MATVNVIAYLMLMQVWRQVSGQDSNCPQNCTSVNIAREGMSSFTSRENHPYDTIGQASWVTDGVTSGQCASVSSIYPVWEAVLGQNRTVSSIKIFWEVQQDDVRVSVGGRICHIPSSSYMWQPEYTLDCDVPLTGNYLQIYRQPTKLLSMLNLSFCEVEIYALPVEASSSMPSSTTTTMPTTPKTLSTTKVRTSPMISSTRNTELLVSMDKSASLSSTQTPITSDVMFSTVSKTSVDNGTPSLPSTQPSMTSDVLSSPRLETSIDNGTPSLPSTQSSSTSDVMSTTAETSNSIVTPSTSTSTAHSSETSTPPSGAGFPLLYVIVVGAVAAGVVTVVTAVGIAVCVKIQKGRKPQAKDAQEEGIPSYEMCEAEPCDPTRNVCENEFTYVNSEYVNDQNVFTGTPCYFKVDYNNQDMDEAGESNVYVNATDLSQYDNSLNIPT